MWRSKIQRGLTAVESNTGRVHPATKGFKGEFSPLQKRSPLPKLVPSQNQKRATAAEALTDAEDDLWFGTITVGTPPQTFTGSFIPSVHGIIFV
jgi:hypothetical protein